MKMHGVPQGVEHSRAEEVSGAAQDGLEERGWMGIAPGTTILVLVFLACFAVYYFTNWKLLSFVWQVG